MKPIGNTRQKKQESISFFFVFADDVKKKRGGTTLQGEKRPVDANDTVSTTKQKRRGHPERERELN